MSMAEKADVRRFWNSRPCGVANSQAAPLSREYYAEIEGFRYATEVHIPKVAEFASYCGKRVLEVGCGMGTDGRQFASNGAYYTALDLSNESLMHARRAFGLWNLSGHFVNGDAENLPFPSDYFSLVYSNGVLHHTPDTRKAVLEVHRVMRPGGKAIVMLYAKSLVFSTGVRWLGRRRLEDLRARMPKAEFNALIGQPAEFSGPLTEEIIINHSTDGIGNPVSRLYTSGEVRSLFHGFRQIDLELHGFPVQKVPGLSRMPNWFKYVIGRALGCAWIIKATK